MTGASILIADDDRGIRTVLDHALGRAGHDVRQPTTEVRSGSGSKPGTAIW